MTISDTFITSHDGTRLYTRLAGEAGPPVLLLHGQGSCGRVWEGLMRGPLAAQTRLIAPDLRGHGRSDRPRGGYRSRHTWAGDIAALVDGLRLDRPVLIGWSYGTAVACDYLRGGGQARAFGLIAGGPEAGILDAEIRRTLGPDLRAAVRARLWSGRRRFAERVVDLFTEHSLERSLHDALVDDVLAISRAAMLGVATRTYLNDDVLAAFTGRILQIHGRKDRVRLPHAAERRTALFRDGTTQIWDGSGHAPFLDEPERFAKAIGAFLDPKDG